MRQESSIPESEQGTAGVTLAGTPPEYWTLAHLTAPYLEEESEDKLTEVLGTCLEHLRRFQLAVHLDTGRRGGLAALESMPPMIPFFISDTDAASGNLAATDEYSQPCRPLDARARRTAQSDV